MRTSGGGEDANLAPGTRFDHYEIEAELGRGGMGTVYVGRDLSLERKVAIKVLQTESTPGGVREQRFIREARAQAQLASPRIVQIYFVGHIAAAPAEAGGTPRPPRLYFAMELVEGASLEAVVGERGPLPPEEVRGHAIQIVEGLRDAFRAGFIHRDVKPSNLLLAEGGYVKIADFGLAKSHDDDVGLTQDGAIVGSPLYMAPEQCRGAEVDFRADMYGLGCTLFHILAGGPPFKGTNALQLIALHTTEKPPRLEKLAPHVDPAFTSVVHRLLAKEPADRFASHDDLLDALHAAAPGSAPAAGFFTRGMAVGIDCVIAGILIWALGWPGIFVHLAYVTLGHWRFGQTVGKYLMRIRVSMTGGGRVPLGRALLRTLLALWYPFLLGATILWSQGWGSLIATIERLYAIGDSRTVVLGMVVNSALLSVVFGAGLLLAAIIPTKRAVHDLIVGTQVTYTLAPVASGSSRGGSPSSVGKSRGAGSR